MKLTERRRLVLGDVHISLETRGELLRRIDEIYAQLLALTNGDGDGAKLNGAAAPSAASLSSPPTEDSDASFDGDATLVPSPAPPEPEGPSPDDTDGPTIVPGTSTGRRDVLKTSRGPCVLFGPVPRTRNTGRRREGKQAADGAPPVAAGGAAPQGGGVRPKEARQQPQRAPPAAKKVDAARGTGLPFRAKPLPVRILADTYKQQKKAEEEVRQLRSKARAEEMLRCAAMPFTTRRPMFQRQCSDPVPNVPVRETLFRASRRAPPATDVLQGDCRKARRSRSCPKLDDQRTLPERPALGIFRRNDASPIFQVPAMHFSLVVRSPTPPGTPVRAKAARAGPRPPLPRVQGSAARPETQVGVAGLSLCGVWLIRGVATAFQAGDACRRIRCTP
ncbi:unnamed protein product [Ixodes pacificus]